MPASVAPSQPGSGRKRRRNPEEELPLSEYLAEKLEDPVLEDAVRDIVDKLVAQPQKILYAQVKVADDSLLPKKKQNIAGASIPENDKPFSEDDKTFDKLPIEYVRTILLPALEPLIFNDDQKIRDAEKAFLGSIKGLFFQALGVKECRKWVKVGKRKDVFMKAALELYNDRGRRLRNFTFATGLKGKYFIDWRTSGIYQLLPLAENKKTHVQHTAGLQQALPEELTVTNQYTIAKPWHESTAVLEIGRLDQTIAKMFPGTDVAQFLSSRHEQVSMAFGAALAELDSIEGGAPDPTPVPPAGRREPASPLREAAVAQLRWRIERRRIRM